MKTKTPFLLFIACLSLFFAAASTSYAEYQLIFERNDVAIYAEYNLAYRDAGVYWRATNYTDREIRISFKPVYHLNHGDGNVEKRTGFITAILKPDVNYTSLEPFIYNSHVYSMRAEVTELKVREIKR